jgi:ribosomal protein L23
LLLGLALLIAVSVSGTTFLGIAVILLFAVKVTMVNSLTAKITVKKLGLP